MTRTLFDSQLLLNEVVAGRHPFLVMFTDIDARDLRIQNRRMLGITEGCQPTIYATSQRGLRRQYDTIDWEYVEGDVTFKIVLLNTNMNDGGFELNLASSITRTPRQDGE